MMMRRLFTSVLLIGLIMPGAIRTFATPRAGDTELSPNEEQEARKLAVSFVKRLDETNNFDPVVAEFLPVNFAECLRQFVLTDEMPDDFFVLCKRDVLAQASADDLRRAYIAVMNFWQQQEALGDVAWDYVKIKSSIDGNKAAQEQEAWAQHLKLKEEAVPEEAFRIAQSDPLLNLFFTLVRRTDDEPSANDSDEAEKIKIAAIAIRNIEHLRAFTEKLERCAALLRKGADNLRAEMKSLATAHSVSDKGKVYEPIPAEPFYIYHLDSELIEKEFFGLPAGTLLIRVRIYPYELMLARVDEQLKIVAVYPDFDGD